MADLLRAQVYEVFSTEGEPEQLRLRMEDGRTAVVKIREITYETEDSNPVIKE